jgi:hypothetical protein
MEKYLVKSILIFDANGSFSFESNFEFLVRLLDQEL